VFGDGTLEDRDLAVEEVDLAQAPVDGLALVAGQLERGQPHAAASPECVAHRRSALEGAHQHRVDLVLGARALAHELRPARQAPAQRPRLLIRQPAAVQQPGGEQPRQRAGVAPVGFDLRLGDCPEFLPGCDDHARRVGFQHPGDRQRVARRLQRHLIVGSEAVRQDLQPLRGTRHATRGAHLPLSQIAISQKSRCTSSPMKRTCSPFTRSDAGDQVGKRQDGFGLAAQPGESQGRPQRCCRARSPAQARPAQPTFSQKAPGPVRPTLTPRPDTTAGTLAAQFHPRRLWVAVISRHSERAADLPRRWKRSIRRLNLVCANTGSTIALRRR
jgi:hypothetical protein